MPRMLVAVIALVVLAAAVQAAVVSSTYEQVDTSISFFPFSPSIRAAMGIFKVELDQPGYFYAGGCKSNNICNITASTPQWGRCCANCTNGAPTPTSSFNVAGCVCPSLLGSYCVDPWTPLDAPSWFQDQPFQQTYLIFEVPIYRACNNFIVDLGLSLGEADINFFPYVTYLANQDPSAVRNAWARKYGPDSIVICAAPGDGIPGYWARAKTSVNDFNTVLGGTPPDGVPRLYGAVQGSGIFQLTITDITHPQSLIPLIGPSGQQWFAAKTATGACNSANFVGAHLPPPFWPVILPSTADPWWDFSTMLGYLKPLSMSTVSGSALTFGIPQSEDLLDRSVNVQGHIGTCVIDLSWVVDSNGMQLAPNSSSLVWSPVTTMCNYTALQQRQVELDQLLQNRAANPINPMQQALSAVWSAGSVTGSMEYAACRRFADSLVQTPIGLPEYNSTLCYYPENSAEYANDPCCNTVLTWYQCCIPRTTATTLVVPDDLAVEALCSVPECSQQVNSLYAVAKQRQVDDSCNIETFQSLLATLNPISATGGQQAGACSPLLASTPTKDTALINCIVNNLDERLIAEFYSFWKRSPSGNFTADLEEQYIINGCIQAGSRPFDTSNNKVAITRNVTLDHNNALCLAANSCNWDFFRHDATSCNTGTYRGSNMCASCQFGYCTERSVFSTCYNPYSYSLGTSKVSLCAAQGGVYEPTDPSVLCYFNDSTITSYSACMSALNATSFCSTTCVGATCSCAPYCYFPAYSAAQCSCAGLPPGDSLTSVCSTLKWNGLYCISSTITYQEQCAVLPGSAFWTGAVWQNPNQFANATVCADQGYCVDQPGLNYTDCMALSTTRGTCSNYCPSPCTQASCETPGCTDSIFAGGACVTGWVGVGADFQFCVSGGIPVIGVGCVFNTANSPKGNITLACLQFGVNPPVYIVPGPSLANQTLCESYVGCQSESEAISAVTPKSASACQQCGGTVKQAFRYGTGVWTPLQPTWIPTTWMPRSYSNIFSVAPMFDSTQFGLDFIYQIYPSQQVRVSNQTTQCLFSQASSAVNSLACDCANSGGSACYTSAQLQLLSLLRACQNLNNTFAFEPYGHLSVSPLATFSPNCLDLELSLARAALFQRSKSSVYSSVFLQSVGNSPYAVVRNTKHKITVGQLVGDGIRIVFRNGVAQGRYTLCLRRSPSIKVSGTFKVPDFASINENLDVSSISPLNIPITLQTDAAGETFLCGDFDISTATETYLPIYRVKGWESARLLDTLTITQRNCFFAAFAFYLAVWLLIVYRAANIVLYSIIIRTKRRGTNMVLLGLVLLFLFLSTTLRWVYFIITPFGALVDKPKIADLLLAEFPFYFWLTIFTLLVAWWVELYHWAVSTRGVFLKKVGWALLAINVVLYAFLTAVIIAFAVTSTRTSTISTVCAGHSASDHGAVVLSKVYKTTLAVVAACVAIGFLVYGGFLLKIMSKSSTPDYTAIVRFSIMAAVCAVALMLQCGLLLYTTYSKGVNTVAALIILIIIEVVPAVVLAIALRQPSLSPKLHEDIFWCCFLGSLADSNTTGSGSSAVATNTGDSKGNSRSYPGPPSFASDHVSVGESRF